MFGVTLVFYGSLDIACMCIGGQLADAIEHRVQYHQSVLHLVRFRIESKLLKIKPYLQWVGVSDTSPFKTLKVQDIDVGSRMPGKLDTNSTRAI